MKNFSKLLINATVAACAFAGSAHAAPILVGSGTLKTANDLTVIKDGNTTYEFLDLTSTRGITAAAAISQFSVDNFAMATDVDLTRLFGSFGFNYASLNNGFKALPITETQANFFVSYLGNTYAGLYNGSYVGSLGHFSDLNNGKGYACIGWTGCGQRAFVNDYDIYSDSIIGTFLVRTAASDVPEPGSLALLGLGVAGFAVARRRRQK